MKNIEITPRDVSVSSKHVLSLLDDGDCVIFPITPIVECIRFPAMSCRSVAQQPFWVISNSRRKKLFQSTCKIWKKKNNRL